MQRRYNYINCKRRYELHLVAGHGIIVYNLRSACGESYYRHHLYRYRSNNKRRLCEYKNHKYNDGIGSLAHYHAHIFCYMQRRNNYLNGERRHDLLLVAWYGIILYKLCSTCSESYYGNYLYTYRNYKSGMYKYKDCIDNHGIPSLAYYYADFFCYMQRRNNYLNGKRRDDLHLVAGHGIILHHLRSTGCQSYYGNNVYAYRYYKSGMYQYKNRFYYDGISSLAYYYTDLFCDLQRRNNHLNSERSHELYLVAGHGIILYNLCSACR
jgi:hypothetical protein